MLSGGLKQEMEMLALHRLTLLTALTFQQVICTLKLLLAIPTIMNTGESVTVFGLGMLHFHLAPMMVQTTLSFIDLESMRPAP